MSTARSSEARRPARVGFDARTSVRFRTDILVIGGGAAGIRAAIAAADCGRVVVLAGPGNADASTLLAQGGIAVPIGDGDSPDQHLSDTLSAGGGLCDEGVARSIIERGEARLGELLEWGLRIDRHREGTPSLGIEGGHRNRRVIRARGDSIGSELHRVLMSRALRQRSIALVTGCVALNILTTDGPPHERCAVGAIIHHPVAGLCTVRARSTILATGGAAGLYERSTSSKQATGDGIAMAFRAGAALRGMEFVQFHPTALDVPVSPRPLISEAVRGEGALLIDERGRRIMEGVHPLAELAPRDIVSRTIASLQASQGTRCYLDARTIHDFPSRFPAVAAELRRHGIDPSNHPIPITPAAHYLVGGVATDLSGRTSLPGLYAAGEVASTGLHGANRLASNSLLECLVMGEAAGRVAGQQSREPSQPDDPMHHAGSVSSRGGPARPPGHRLDSSKSGTAVGPTAHSLRELMWTHVGILRDEHGLRRAAHEFDASRHALSDTLPSGPDAWKLRNVITVASLIARAALARKASAGCHHRIDRPEQTRLCARNEYPSAPAPTAAPPSTGYERGPRTLPT